jgi:hypothetical protein
MAEDYLHITRWHAAVFPFSIEGGISVVTSAMPKG